MSDPVSDLKHELLAAAERQQGHAPVDTARRWRARPGRNRLLLAAATVAIAAAVALLVTAPWNSSPGLLAKAEAALTPPPGSVLHMKWESTESPTNPQCTVTRGPNEIWIDQTEPHRYRVLFFDLDPYRPGDPRAHVCSKSTPFEFGGTFTTSARAEWALRFVPPNRLGFQSYTFNFPWDPVADLRRAISDGHAHDEGETRLDGRTVERIRLSPLPCPDSTTAPCPDMAHFYVDPETFAPVELDGFAVIAPPGVPAVRYRSVTRYLTFEYLPRTAANLALTSIRAQHPNATGP